MRNLKRSVKLMGLATLAGTFLGCASLERSLTDQGYKRLNATEIGPTLAGKTLIGRREGSQNKLVVFIATNGRLRGMGSNPAGQLQRDKGKWRVTSDGLFCDRWERWRALSDCDRVYRRGNHIVMVNPDGAKRKPITSPFGY